MTEIIVWEGDHTCINIDCDNKIPDLFVEKQQNHKKYRVCVRCRASKQLSWKCVGCTNVMYDVKVNVGRFHCSDSCKVKYHNDKRHGKIKYSVKPHMLKGKKYIKCRWCKRPILRGHKLFCNEVCKRNNIKLIYYRKRVRVASNSRTKDRLSSHRRVCNSSKRTSYHKRYNMINYKVKKLVKEINSRNT
jgi:hypothetical protein